MSQVLFQMSATIGYMPAFKLMPVQVTNDASCVAISNGGSRVQFAQLPHAQCLVQLLQALA